MSPDYYVFIGNGCEHCDIFLKRWEKVQSMFGFSYEIKDIWGSEGDYRFFEQCIPDTDAGVPCVFHPTSRRILAGAQSLKKIQAFILGGPSDSVVP
jgi:hypothetical protein